MGFHFWLILGFAGQLVFTARFLVQWIATEKKRQSVVPVAFWWLSICGSILLLAYAVHRRDPVFILGNAFGMLVYTRNLYFLKKNKQHGSRATITDAGESG